MTAAEVHLYEDLRLVLLAEQALASGSLTPEQVGRAVEVTKESKLAGQVAEAKAKLEQARRAKGF